MTRQNLLITLCRSEVAPRFDMTAEVLLMPMPTPETLALPQEQQEWRHLVLAHTSSEELCDHITRLDVAMVICGGIEEDYYHYLRWKRIEVVSDVMGEVKDVLASLASGTLQSGDSLYPRRKGHDCQPPV